MKICLVTTFPPSRGGLSEYGFHIANELTRNPFLSLTVLADTLDGAEADPPGFSVDRCWSFGRPQHFDTTPERNPAAQTRRRLVQPSIYHLRTQPLRGLLRLGCTSTYASEWPLYPCDLAPSDGCN